MSKIIVIGGSAGAVGALEVILSMLPSEFPAPVLIVTHIGPHKSLLPEILARSSLLPVRHATDGERLLPGCVLLAPPDEHLTVIMKSGQPYIQLLHGPKENHCRPAIDPLFRSAASSFLDNAIGIVLSGYLDDGTVGLQAIKACGGFAIVQDPIEAEALDMPASAIEHVNVDRVLRVMDIGPTLVELVAGSSGGAASTASPASAPKWIDIENRIARESSDMNDLDQIGKASSLTCPECKGALWEIDDSSPIRYRCHTGHAFTAAVLETLQRQALEDATWGAIRALHEQERLFGKMCERERKLGHPERAAEYESKAKQATAHSKILRDLISTCALIRKEGSM